MTRSKLRALVEALRIHQWIKNGFIFAAPVFGRKIADPTVAGRTVAAFLVFSLAASAVYVLNDLIDHERDRAHPKKRRRPIASGRVTRSEAMVLVAILVFAATILSFALLPPVATALIGVYLVANALYTFRLKHVVILDVMFIAVGFLIRVLTGAAAAQVAPSHWLLLCTLTVSLFLGFTKRRAEIVAMNDNARDHRRVLDHYSIAFLDQMIAIVTGATLVCYILYTVDARTVAEFGSPYLVATVPFVLYGVFRYLYLGYHRDEGGNPTRAILTDWPFLVNLALWGLACLAVIYYGDALAAHFPWETLPHP